jgi:hypothetical protein
LPVHGEIIKVPGEVGPALGLAGDYRHGRFVGRDADDALVGRVAPIHVPTGGLRDRRDAETYGRGPLGPTKH